MQKSPINIIFSLKKPANYIIDLLSLFVFLAFSSILKLIGIDRSSLYIGRVLKMIGPLSKTGKIVRNNINLVYKDTLTDLQKTNIELGAWENLGKYIGEFPFVEENFLKRNQSRVKIEGLEKISALKKSGTPFIIFSSHSANWEFILYSIIKECGSVSIIYRKLNNKFLNNYIKKKRSILNVHMIEKGNSGAKELIKSIKKKNNLLLLQDQKMNEGISVPFLGLDAKTSKAAAVIARANNYPLVPTYIKRTYGANFKIIIDDPFYPEITDSKEADIYNTTLSMNNKLSDWIKQNPKEWFWQHQRWIKF
jgi:Kdo2-lipid IVA lauroyltransferase/acyltransferase